MEEDANESKSSGEHTDFGRGVNAKMDAACITGIGRRAASAMRLWATI
jgi:hypothetical protein